MTMIVVKTWSDGGLKRFGLYNSKC